MRYTPDHKMESRRRIVQAATSSLLQGLPSGATVTLTVAAVNAAGEGTPAHLAPVVVP